MKVKAKSFVHDHVVDDYDHRALSPGRTYYVVGIDSEYFRIIDDNDEPILYRKELFEIVDPSIPDDWVTEKYDEDYFIDPPEFAEPGFYEDYFDGVAGAVEKFETFRKLHGIPCDRGNEKK